MRHTNASVATLFSSRQQSVGYIRISNGLPKNAMFAHDVVEALRTSKIVGVRSGTAHRYTGVWVVVIDGRIFVRSWNDKPTGWFRAFRKEPNGTVQIAGLEIPVRAKLTRSARMREAVTVAYGREVQHEGVTEVGGGIWRTGT
jgi:hypothetical protein